MKNYIDNIQNLNKKQFVKLLSSYDDELKNYAALKARKISNERFGKKIYIRGIIEFSNICKNDCLYCGIRCSNSNVKRFRLTEEEIMNCCGNGYNLGLRTFVLQGGEDPYYDDDRMENIVSKIKRKYPDCAITLSLGERSRESYERLKNAGADRYLLRHETADPEHYSKLHPENMKLATRMECLKNLKSLGYQSGCGMMVGSPYQTIENIAEDFLFLKNYQPEMVGIGPFLPQKDTPFKDMPAGSSDFTLFLISLIRLLLPDSLIPATTALGSAKRNGRIEGILAGANVIMPNLSPEDTKKKYLLYDGKDSINDEAFYVIENLKRHLDEIGYEIDFGRGDYRKHQ